MIGACLRAGARFSITTLLNPTICAATASIPDTAWIPVRSRQAIYDEQTRQWISDAEVAEATYTAFNNRTTNMPVTARLIVRRVKDKNVNDQQGGCSPRGGITPRFHQQRRGPHHRRSPPSRARPRRAGHRRPHRLRSGPPALRDVHRERRLADLRDHRPQLHPAARGGAGRRSIRSERIWPRIGTGRSLSRCARRGVS